MARPVYPSLLTEIQNLVRYAA